MFFFLHSVGTALDSETLLTHPINSDGAPNLDEGCADHLADCCDEWWCGLSHIDLLTVTDVNIASGLAGVS